MASPATKDVTPPSRTAALIATDRRWGAHNYHPLPVVIERGEGAWVTDVEGKRYIDMLGAYSAMSFGHCHPELVATAREQVGKLTLTSRAFHNDQLPAFCQELATLCEQDRVLPMNTGAEAVETALKAARRWGYEVKGVPRGEARIIVFANNFHGRTIAIVGMSTSPSAYEGYGPFPSGFDIVPYGDLEAVRGAVRDQTVAVLVEPIQGEGGVIIPPEGFLRGLREICDEQNVLLLCDEVQTGLGRTGMILDAHHEGVRADVTILGKALSGGLLPVSAIVGTEEVMGVFTPGTHGSTFGGNPLGAAVARKALEILQRDELVERAATLGRYLQESLAAIDSPFVAEVRGRGMLRAIELTEEAGPAKAIAEALLERGVLTKQAKTSVLRLAPPLTIAREDLDFAVTQIAETLRDHEP